MIKFKEFFSDKPKTYFLISISVIVIYLVLFLKPQMKELFLKSAEVSQLKTKVVNTEKQWANIDSLKKQVLRMNEKIDYYEKKLPSEKEIPAVLEYLSSAAKKMNVRITEIRPVKQDKDKTVIPSPYYKAPILLKAECGYHQLGRFLDKLESADRFMKISDIKIETNPRKTSIHNVQLIVVTYVMER